jgi:dTDP-glucose 4,6-dehydratase
MSRIIVTGGAGFIGSVLVRRLFENYFDHFDNLLVIDKFTYAAKVENLGSWVNSPKFDLQVIDIAKFDDLNQVILDDDLIFHLAAESHVDNSIANGSVFWETNTLGTSNILEIMRRRSGVRLLYVSTDEVYGSIISGSFSEDSMLNPSSPYSASKAAGDLACLAYLKTHELNLNITRCSNNFGQEQHSEKFLPVLVRNIVNGNPVPIYGNGTNVREWIPAWVHAEYLIRIMFSDVQSEIFNIGSGIELSNLEIVSKVANILKREFVTNFVLDRKAHDFRYSIVNSKVTKMFGDVNFDFDAEIANTVMNLAESL